MDDKWYQESYSSQLITWLIEIDETLKNIAESLRKLSGREEEE